MKKILTILFFVSILIISSQVKAQEITEPIKSYLSLIDGFSKPIGNFGSYNYYNNKAGFGKQNTTFGFDGCIYLYKNLGIGYNLTYQDQGELSQNDALLLATGYTADFIKSAATVITSNRYVSINFMAGPQYSFVYKGFTLDLRTSIGFIKNLSTPETEIIFDYNSTNTATIIHQLSSSSTAFSFGASGTIRYALSDSWDIGIKSGILHSGGPTIENTNNTGTIGRFVTKQPMTMIQSTLGITLKF